MINPCTNVLGSINLVCSVKPAANTPLYNAMEFVLDIGQCGTALTPWWDMSASQLPTCALATVPRSINGTFDFTAQDVNGVSLFTQCTDVWGLKGGGALFDVQPSPGTGLTSASARLFGVCAFNDGSNKPLAGGGPEYYMLFVRIPRQKSSSNPLDTNCPGCLTGTTIVLNNIKMIQPAGSPGGDVNVSGDGVSNVFQYNGGQICNPTSARKTTWGSVKALYR